MIENGANVNAKDEDGDTALAYAAIRGAPANVIKQLLNAGADVSIKNNHGKTAIMLAKEQGKNQILELLKQAGSR